MSIATAWLAAAAAVLGCAPGVNGSTTDDPRPTTLRHADSAVDSVAPVPEPEDAAQSEQSIGDRYAYARVLMGTQCRIVAEAPSESAAALAARAAFARIAALEGVLSDYRLDSEIMRLTTTDAASNRGTDDPPPHAWQTISADLAEALRLSRVVWARSDGAFDVTLGPLTQLWRETRRTGQLPDPDVLMTARARSGFQHLAVREEPAPALQFRVEGMRLDFGGIGKGLAADKAAEVLRARGIDRFLIDFGGDIVAGDPPSDNPEGWRVEVRDGVAEQTRTVIIANLAIATSGDLEQFVEIDGVRYAHVLDPATGLGLTSRTAATVLATLGWLADALASAACVIGTDQPDRIRQLRESFGADVVEIDVRRPEGPELPRAVEETSKR